MKWIYHHSMCLDKTILIVVILYLINFRCLIILCTMHAHSFIIGYALRSPVQWSFWVQSYQFLAQSCEFWCRPNLNSVQTSLPSDWVNRAESCDVDQSDWTKYTWPIYISKLLNSCCHTPVFLKFAIYLHFNMFFMLDHSLSNSFLLLHNILFWSLQ